MCSHRAAGVAVSQMGTLMSKKHLCQCNVYTCKCAGAQITYSKVHATLIAKNCTYIYTYTHMHTYTHAHKYTCASTTPPTR